MQTRLGSLPFEFNGTTVAISRDPIADDIGNTVAWRHNWTVAGQWTADDQATLLAKCARMEQQLDAGGDLVLLRNDGSVARALRNAGSTTGVSVGNLSYPPALGGELNTFASFSFTASAEYPASDSLPLLSWNEKVSVSGGLPIYVHRRAVNGPPQKQLVSPLGETIVVQSGAASGLGFAPPKPPPLLLVSDVFDQSDETENNGRVITRTWMYRFEVTRAVVVAPHARPS
jgi:hypothetical protein